MRNSTRSKSTPATDALLTAKEQTTCKRLAGGTGAAAQRARALLSLQAGDTQIQAASVSGLTAGQVKYWAARFRKQRLAIFPEASKPPGKTKAAAPAARTAKDTSTREARPPKAKGEKEPAKRGKKKAGKGKEEKMGKKGKSDKKGKKGKKDKKGKKKGGKGKKK